MSVSEQIKSMAPAHAAYFRLRLPFSDGSFREHPSDGLGYYALGEPPWGVPSNQYFVQFYDAERRPLQHKESQIRIEGSANILRGSGQMNLHLLNAQGASPKLPAAPARTTEPAASYVATQPLDPQEIELRRHLQAMDLEDRQQEFIKSSAYVTELGETFTLNRLLRRDLLEMHRIVVAHSQRAYQDIDQVKGTIHDLLALQKAVLEHAATAISRPPPPPPDYVGLGHSALAVVKEVSAALITRSMGRELASLSRGAQTEAKAQISDGAQAKEAEISKASAPAEKGDAETAKGTSAIAVPAPRDALAKLVQRLQGLSDAELATAMSSVEGWKALLDSLRKGETVSGDTAQKTNVATSEEAALAKS